MIVLSDLLEEDDHKEVRNDYKEILEDGWNYTSDGILVVVLGIGIL